MQILAKAAVMVLRVTYFFFKLFLKPKRKITLLSRQSDLPTEDFALLYAAIEKSGFDGRVKMLTKKIPAGLFGKTWYAFHMLSQMYHIATARVIVVDGYNIAVCVTSHKPEQKVVQLWHALNIIKKFGYAALDKPWGRRSDTAKTFCMHRNYDYVVACSEKSAEVLCECFNTTHDKTVLLPLPRIDYILNAPEKREEIATAYPGIFKKPILLYAPTFRGEQVSLSWIEKTVDSDKYNVVVKLHPADKLGLDTSVAKSVLCDQSFSSFDWMKVSDKVITDYSGMGFEAMLLKKQVYFYLYDYEDYTAKNGLALDLFSEPICDKVTSSAKELKELLQKDYDYLKSAEYVKKYLSVGTENCSQRLADFIIKLV